MLRIGILAAAMLALSAAVPAPALTVGGAFVRVHRFDERAIAALPHVAVSAVDGEHGGPSVRYDGVTLASLLHAAGVPVGAGVKGKPARSFVIVHAADGYAAVFSAGELVSATARCEPVLAYRRNGAAMVEPLGPFRILARCDKTHARWVREVTGFTIVTVPDTKRPSVR